MPTGPSVITNNLFPNDPTFVVLATREEGAAALAVVPARIRGSSIADNRQIAWYAQESQQTRWLLDPDHLIVEDLFINAWTVDTTSGALDRPLQPLGYIIKLKKVKTPLFRAILNLVKARAQDD